MLGGMGQLSDFRESASPETFSLPCVTWGSVEPAVQVSVRTKLDAALL